MNIQINAKKKKTKKKLENNNDKVTDRFGLIA